MSIEVDVTKLSDALRDFAMGYLLTNSGGRTKVVSVLPSLVEGALLISPASRGSVANIAENPQVTLVFPPFSSEGFTLLIDGTATVLDATISVAPSTAVLHQSAS